MGQLTTNSDGLWHDPRYGPSLVQKMTKWLGEMTPKAT